MESNTSIKETLSDNRIFLNGKQLAEVLGVSAPTVSEAAKNGWKCGGYPIVEWAVETDSGRIQGYEVPEFLVNEGLIEEKRSNPDSNKPNLALIKANENKKPDIQASNQTNYYSLLPEGEDYVRPVGMISLSSVMNTALKSDTPQSKAVITGSLVALGAIVGHAVTEKASGAGVGASTGLAIALLAYKYFDSTTNTELSAFGKNKFAKQKAVLIPKELTKQSAFTPN